MIEQMECLKHWLSKGWLDQLNINLLEEEEGKGGKAEVEGNVQGIKYLASLLKTPNKLDSYT